MLAAIRCWREWGHCRQIFVEMPAATSFTSANSWITSQFLNLYSHVGRHLVGNIVTRAVGSTNAPSTTLRRDQRVRDHAVKRRFRRRNLLIDVSTLPKLASNRFSFLSIKIGCHAPHVCCNWGNSKAHLTWFWNESEFGPDIEFDFTNMAVDWFHTILSSTSSPGISRNRNQWPARQR